MKIILYSYSIGFAELEFQVKCNGKSNTRTINRNNSNYYIRLLLGVIRNQMNFSKTKVLQ
jgi:hypothetical protein